MKFALGLALFIYLHSTNVNGEAAIPAKRYKVDLDVPPMERWLPVVKDFDRSSILAVIDTLEKEYIKTHLLIDLADYIGKYLEKYMPQPYADEIRGIAQYYNVSVGKIVLGNIAYDVSAWNSDRLRSIMGCTSIVAVDKKGDIIHGRNLDYAVANLLRDITAEVEFHYSGKTAFIATTFIGYVGLLTAKKPMAFTLTGDQRNTGSVAENIAAAFEKHWPTMLMSREVMTHADDYESAVKMIANADTISPMYFIVGGIKPREGAVIVRDRWGAVNITRMDETTHNWFVLETNYDPWMKPPASDDRRDTALWAMKEVGQARMDLDSLYGVLSIPPVFNHQTTYTTVMSAADDAAYRTMIRYDCPDNINYS